MNFKEVKEQVKNWGERNKGKIIIGVGTILGIGAGAMALALSKNNEDYLNEILTLPEDYDYGKDLEMHYVDPENGEVLWKGLCTESYMNDMKDCDMESETIRQLNGIEEE